jgi:hypothetical protein
MSRPLLPIDHKGLTRREAADMLRGLADFVETYPTEGVVLTVDLEVAATGSITNATSARKKTARAR